MSDYSQWSSGGAGGSGGSDYASFKPATVPKPAGPGGGSSGINFGSLAHSFLSGLAHAATHPVSTANNMVVKPTVDAWKKLPSDVGHTTAAIGDLAQGAVKGNDAYKLQQIDKANKEFHQTFLGKAAQTITDAAHTGAKTNKVDWGKLGTAGRQAAGATIDKSLSLAGPEDLLAKGGNKIVENVGVKALTGEGVKQGVKYGLASGTGQALQEKNFNAQNVATDVGGGAVAGGLLGGITGGTAGLLSKALHGWVNLAAKSAHPDAQTEGPKLLALPAGEKPTALPAGKKTAGLPAESPTNPIKTTAGPNGGKVGEFNTVSPGTASKIAALNHTISNFHSEGEKVAPARKTIDLSTAPGKDVPLKDKVAAAGQTKAQDHLDALSKIQTLRNQAATTMDALAQDRAAMLKGLHDETGGVDLFHKESEYGPDTKQRASRNDPFYRQYYKDNGRPPTKAAWLEEAHRQLATAPDEQAQHYQAAAQLAESAHAAYQEKLGSVKMTDVYAPKTSADRASAAKEQLAAAEAQSGQERLGEVHPFTPVADQVPVPELIKQLNGVDSGNSRLSRLQVLNKLIQHPDISPENKQVWIAQRDALKPSAKTEAPNVTQPAAPPPTPQVTKSETPSATTTEPPPEPKPKTTSDKTTATPPGSASDVAAPKRSLAEKLVNKVTAGKGSGLLNPSRAAGREGNVKFARTATDLVSNKRVVTYKAKAAAKELKGLMKGLNADDVNAAIEGATPKNDKVAAAAAFFKAHRDAIGEKSVDAGILKGQKDNYLPHVARGLESRRGGGANGLKKNTRYNLERQTIEHVENGKVVKEDKYKTLDDFEKAVQKIDPKATAERDTAKLLEHLLITEGHAVENAKTVDKLMDTRMTDGRPVLARATDANLASPNYKGYTVLDNKMVHPDAVPLYEAVTKTGRIDNPLGAALVKANVLTKRLVTVNGMVHALNIWKSSFAAQGVSRSLWAIVSPGAKQEDFIRALGYGAKFARASNDNLFDEVGKATGVLGKLEKATDPLTHALFHNFGDRQGMSTFLYIEKKAQKMGLSPDEAGRVAADGANQVMHFIPEDQQSIVVRQSAQVALFAGQFLQNTQKTATNALGVGLDRTLSKEGQRAAQKLAVQRVARMFAYSFASAQAINLATTGKYTWQNGNGDPMNPVWFQTKDKYGNVKQYRITNHYGQLKDIANLILHPAQEVQNKLAPGAREVVSQIANTDLFTTDKIADTKQGEGAQLVDRLVHAASNMFTPAGINLSSPSKQPGLVQGAKYLGVNSSSVKPNDHYDYAKGATDKAAAQKLVDAYNKGDLSKLAAMQALKASGNGYFDKFFKQNPTLDPTSNQFQGYQANDSKKVSAAISAGFSTAKTNGTSLAYMQSVKESGSSYFNKFFAAHPNLDPTSQNYDGSGSKQAAQAKSEAKYQEKGAKYAAEKYRSKASVKAPVRTTVKGKGSHISLKGPTIKPIKSIKVAAPKKIGAKGLVRRVKKIGL